MNIEECELRGIYDNDKKTLHIFHEGTHVASINIPHSSQESLTLDCKRDELRLPRGQPWPGGHIGRMAPLRVYRHERIRHGSCNQWHCGS